MTKEEIQKNSEHWYNKYKDAEKRITDLENKIADIKANCDLAIEGRDIKIMELEKENAELKEALKGKRCNCMTYFNFKDLENNLTKAKEILEKLANMEYAINLPADKVRSLMVKAEKFLKEIKENDRTRIIQ